MHTTITVQFVHTPTYVVRPIFRLKLTMFCFAHTQSLRHQRVVYNLKLSDKPIALMMPRKISMLAPVRKIALYRRPVQKCFVLQGGQPQLPLMLDLAHPLDSLAANA